MIIYDLLRTKYTIDFVLSYISPGIKEVLTVGSQESGVRKTGDGKTGDWVFPSDFDLI